MTMMADVEKDMLNSNLNKNFDEILDRLSYLNMVIRNLKMRDTVVVTDVAEVDEKLIREIVNYEILTEEMKRNVVLLLIEDVIQLEGACNKNENNFDKAFESLGKINNLINFMSDCEDDTRKSKALQELIISAKSKLNEIKVDMSNRINEKRGPGKGFDIPI